MKIAEKLARFRESKLLPSYITSSQLAEVKISNPRFMKYCIFEQGVNLSSQIISRTLATFLGAHSYMNDGGYLRPNVFIGRYCSIGRRVSIGAGNHPLSGLSTHPQLVYGNGSPYTESEAASLNHRTATSQATVIGNDVWIGDGAIILAGVTIGTGAVIGANSVITRNVAPYEVTAGIPGRTIRLRFPKEIAEELLQSEWWELPLEKLKGLPRANIYEFIKEIDSEHQTKLHSHGHFQTYAIE